MKVTCHGQAGHSALAPDFLNAIHVAADFVHQTRGLQDRLAAGPQDTAYTIPYSTVHIGKISGGRALNIVPDYTQIEMEFRDLANIPAHQIQRDIEEIAKQLSHAHQSAAPIIVEVVNSYPGLEVETMHETVDFARRLAGDGAITKVPFGTEAGFFAELGLTAVVIGPGDMARDGHKPDEGLSKSELTMCDEMMGNILAELR